MSRRNKAIHLLKMHRDELADALTEAILDSDEWRDIDGFSTGYEKVAEIGDRLWRTNQIINNFPPEPSDVSVTKADHQFTQPTGDNNIDLRSFVIQQGVPLPTWDDFVRAVEGETRNEAARILGILTKLDQPLAFQATNVFAAQLALFPDEFKGKALSLRAQLCAGAAGSVHLIHELFGITGPLATEIYHSLRAVV